MSDLATPEELKAAYQLGVGSPRCELSISQLTEKLKFSREKSSQVVNKLVSSRAASFPKPNARGELVVMIRDQELALRLRKVDSSETYAVFCAIEAAGSVGTGTREIAKVVNERLAGKAGISAPQVTKAIKTLEAERIVKQIKSIHNKAKKLYIASNVQADTSVVGGVFYKDGEFDDELVDQYRERILHYVSSHGASPLKSIVSFLKSSGFKIDLSDQDIDAVFRTLVLDQKLTASVHPQSGDVFYGSGRWPDFEELESLPCSTCPHFDECHIEDIDRFDAIMLRQTLVASDKQRKSMPNLEDTPSNANIFSSKINPATCPYYSQWLGLSAFEPCVPVPENSTGD